MHTISSPDTLSRGDVLHHPVYGFATVESQDASGARLRWELPGPHHPAQVASNVLGDTYRRCTPGGFFERSVTAPDAARRALAVDAAGTLAELIVELGEPQRDEDLRDWLLQRNLLTRARAGAWLDALRPTLAADPRFVLADGTVGLADGILVTGADGNAVAGTVRVSPEEALAYGSRLALALAKLHDGGHALAEGADAIHESRDGFLLAPGGMAVDARRREDVQRVVLAVVESVLGPLPAAEGAAEVDLVAWLGGVTPALPIELLSLVNDAVSDERSLRPQDGMALVERFAVARACAEARAQLGWMRGACAAAGFDTHIGIVKSLQGQTNQDTFVAVGEQDSALLAVCDGISQCTAGSGDLASGLAARGLRGHWHDHAESLRDVDSTRVLAWLNDALTRANNLVCEGARRIAGPDLPRVVPMGTTAVVAMTRGNRAHIANLGDSHAYLVGRHGVAVLTTDHNVTAEHLRGTLAREADDDLPSQGYALTRFLGHFDEDMNAALPEPFTRVVDMLPGEWLVLCSDGFTDYAASDAAGIARVLRHEVAAVAGLAPGAAAMDLARRLVVAANKGGGGDNITVIALTLAPPVLQGDPTQDEG